MPVSRGAAQHGAPSRGGRKAGPAKRTARRTAKRTTAKAPAPQRPAAKPRAALIQRARKIARTLIVSYPDARCMLDYRSAFELLVATILAAQCTDERVNQVTPGLFARFPDAAAMAKADIEELESIIRPTGFFHNKAKSIKGAAETISTRFGGSFPSRMEDLLTLPGVGRKTANVVLGECFSEPGIVVDTHMRRVAQRLGLATSDDPEEIERQLAALIPRADWTRFSHAATFHGRRCCFARKPDHEHCPVRSLCPSRDL